MPHELPALLELMERGGLDKFYLSHLIYAGRGNKQPRRRRASSARRARPWTSLFERAWRAAPKRQRRREFVTGNNDADGGLSAALGRAHASPSAVGAPARQAGAAGAATATGVNVANIDNLGNVHPDTIGGTTRLGNVKERPFSAIWPRPVRSGHGGPEAPAAADRRPLRRLRPFRRSAAATRGCGALQHHRRSLGRGSRLLPHRRGDRPDPAGSASRVMRLPRRAPERRWRFCSRALLARRGGAAADGGRRSTPQHCAACHGADRLGGMGPALLPESLGRLSRTAGRGGDRRGSRRDADAGLRRQARQATRSRPWPPTSRTPLPPVPHWGDGGDRGTRVSLMPHAEPCRTGRASRPTR